MTDVREQGLQVFRELLPGVLPDGVLPEGSFGGEIAEVIYHCTGYAGFPAANSAMAIAKEGLAATPDGDGAT